ncbi:MAG TPA: efflux RND transporter permease subunit, partial [bacterium]|nr:efflux RND transporter permease subunit [bacterium]
MESLFRFFVERRTLANLAMIMVLLLGLSTFAYIKRDIYPEVNFGQLQITTVYPGAAPEDVELNVTNKIEDELDGVSGIKRMTSYSMENVSAVMVTVDPNVSDQDKVVDDIREAVARVTDLPAEVTESPHIVEITTAVIPIIEVGIAGDLPYPELREIAKEGERRLTELSGVSRVDKFGYRAREIKVEVSPGAMSRYQIPMAEIIAAIQGRNIRSTAGSFESYTSEKNVVTLAQFDDPMEVGDVVIRSTFDGPLIKVKDLAVVRDDFEDETFLSRMNGTTAISFVVYKTDTADIIRTVDSIKEMVEDASRNLPEGVEILYSTDASRSVRNRFGVVTSNGLMGLVLVLVILAFFLNLRTAFWVAMGIPFALMGTVFMLPLFGVYLDSIALSSMILVIGIIVDDAIVIAENIFRHRERGLSPQDAAVQGVKEVAAPVVATVLTTFLAFAPMFFMPGFMGKFVYVIPLVISLALFISLGEALFVLPSHMSHAFKKWKKDPPLRARIFAKLHAHYQRVLPGLLRLRYLLVILFIAALMGAVYYAATYMNFVLMPGGMADQFYIFTEYPTGTSLQATSDMTERMEAVVMELPEEELASFVTRVGWNPFLHTQSENYVSIAVDLTPFATRDRSAEQIVEELRRKSEAFDGGGRTVFTIETGGPPVGRPIELRVVGSDDDLRVAMTDSVTAVLSTLVGVQDIDRDDKPGKDQVEIKINYDRLARLGLNVASIARNVRMAYDGEVVTSVRYGDEDVDFRVILEGARERDIDYLRQIRVPNARGRLIPLRDFASLEVGPGPSDYRHYDGERSITIEASIAEGSELTPLEATGAVVAHFDAETENWPGTSIVVGGEAQEMSESMAGLFQALAIAVIAIYFLLILLFNSVTQPILVLIAIPFGMTGVIVTFALHGADMGFMAMLGVIGLGGVVVNDSLVLVSRLNELRVTKPEATIIEIVAEGTADRLRPIIMTSLTTVAGLLPIAYGFGGTDPWMAPMALALGYGLV